MKKNSKVYVLILSTWLVLASAVIYPFITESAKAPNLFLSILLGLNGAFILYFWLNGTKDIVYTLNYWVRKNDFDKNTKTISDSKIDLLNQPKVVLVYTTCDDFIEESLVESMKQNYDNFSTVILDDSKTKEYKKIVKNFGASHPEVKIIRRRKANGFKAGNLNHYLVGNKTYDYFVVLDSDEIIPRDFITKALRYFSFYDNIGIVQGNHVSTRNMNRFMSRFAIGVDSHWGTYQSIKQASGFMSFLGHGAMISRECFNAVGKFPETVAEDLCFSIEARYENYFVAFARDIVCEEQYPVDYMAFKKRHSKWTQGNMEFIKTYTKRIITGNMTWFEKLDIFLFTYNLPLTALLATYIAMNIILFPILGYSIREYPAWLLIPTIIFLIAPMLNDIIYFSRILKARKIVMYILNVMVLYGSMYFISLYSSLKSILGEKAIFIVTPKDKRHVGIRQSIIENYREIIFTFTLVGISMYLCKSILPVILLVVPGILSPYLGILSDKKVLKNDPKANSLDTLIFAETNKFGKMDKAFVELISRNLTQFKVVKVRKNIKYLKEYDDKNIICVPNINDEKISNSFYLLAKKLPEWSSVSVIVPEYQESSKWFGRKAKKAFKKMKRELKENNISSSLNIVKFHL